jgi:epidermal growth factor receptor substrate 15
MLFADCLCLPVANAHPNLNLNPQERQLYGQLFKQCDAEEGGIVTGEAAVKLFQRTRLSEQVLGEVRRPASSPLT